MPPSLVTEIILRMFRILLERCPGGWAPSGPPRVSYRTRASEARNIREFTADPIPG